MNAGRTAEEREAARREREARRAARRQAGGDGKGSLQEAAPRIREALRRRRENARPSSSPGRARPLALVAIGLSLAIVAWLALSLFQPFGGDGSGRVLVVIPKSSGVGRIGDILKQRGVVSSSFFFNLRATVSGRRGDLKPGSYHLKRDMSYGAALDALAKGPPSNIVTLTIPEGRSRREVSRLIGHSLRGDYLAATRSSTLLNPRRYGAKQARDLEGFLFPATYELRRGRSVALLVEQQLTAFKQRFRGVGLRYARRKNLTPYDVLTIASMVEREAQLPRERALVASVIYNRLHAHIPLGIDATIRFATNNWQRPLSKSELASPSPYNTRRMAGLPPGPIGSPGLASIRAAAHPARTRYLYYVVKPGGNGAHVFSKTNAQFQRDVKRYYRARAKRGGRSPASP
jgi:UPF0755 protein